MVQKELFYGPKVELYCQLARYITLQNLYNTALSGEESNEAHEIDFLELN